MPSSPRAAITEISRSNGTKDSRISGTLPIAAQVPAGKPVVSYCNTGHWAATDWFVLHEMLGRPQVRVYDGSMVDWSADAHRPVESSRTKWDDLKKALGLGS